jgi:hypothetical protein
VATWIALFSLFFPAQVTPTVVADTATEEGQYYQILTLPIPEGVILEAGALQVMPDGQLAVSTRIGDIYMIEGAFGNPPAGVKYHPYASAFHQNANHPIRSLSPGEGVTQIHSI